MRKYSSLCITSLVCCSRNILPRLFVACIIASVALLLGTSAAFADSNPNVTIVNPVSGAAIYSENLLISVKMTTPTAIKVSVSQEFKVVNSTNTSITLEEYRKTDPSETASVPMGDSDSFAGTNNLSFYTKKVENVKPGIYKIKVETVDAENKTTHVNASVLEIKAKEESPADIAVLESQPSGAAQFLKGLLKILFKD